MSYTAEELEKLIQNPGSPYQMQTDCPNCFTTNYRDFPRGSRAQARNLPLEERSCSHCGCVLHDAIWYPPVDIKRN